MSLKSTICIILTISITYSLYAFGIQTFLSGFLLQRIVLPEINIKSDKYENPINCNDISRLRLLSSFSKSMYTKKTSNFHHFNKVIIIIIDALRFDFTQPSPVKEFHLNQMPVFQESIAKHPNHAIIFKCIADAPTTTLQRLKALTTGSMPTFIDVSKNFASEKVDEDNIISQMNVNNKHIVFMGDDTWKSLFPNQFYRSFPYPSFNVKDLDTVDEGVLQHLFEEIKKNDSDVIIAHFLGVDHCGHRYGPKHPEMARKLQQMNSVIRSVIGNMTGNSLLLVLGDHGMTETGDHGGDSDSETSSALFVYSPRKIIVQPKKEITTVSQMDIVPTLSFLLNLPIPFSNLGIAITSLLDFQPVEECVNPGVHMALTSALSLMENSLQVHQFLKAYSNISSQLPQSFVSQAEEDLQNLSLAWEKLPDDAITNPIPILNISEGYREYLKNIQQVYAKTWTTFDTSLILFGCVILFCALIFNLWATTTQSNVSLLSNMQSNISPLSTQSEGNSPGTEQPYSNPICIEQTDCSLTSLFIFCLFVLVVVVLCIQDTFGLVNVLTILSTSAISVGIQKWTMNIFNRKYFYIIGFFNIFLSLFVVLCANGSSIFDFWFIAMTLSVLLVSHLILCIGKELIQLVYHVVTKFYFPTGVLFILFVTSFSNSFVIHEEKTVMCILLMSVMYRFLPLCTDSIRGYALSKSKGTKRNSKFFLKPMLPLMYLACLVLCIRVGTMFYKCREEQSPCENSDLLLSLEKLYHSQSYKGSRLVLSLASCALPALIFLGALSYKYSISKTSTVCAVCVKYGTLFVCVMTCLRWWLNIVSPHVVDRILKGNEVVLTRASCFTTLSLILLLFFFPILTEKPWELESREIYGGSMISFVFVILQFLYLVSGDALSPAIMLMALSAVLYLILMTYQSDTSESQIWMDVLIWSLLSRHWFYATAHQAAFPSIHWDAAFLLSQKEVQSYLLSGALVTINTFASAVFYGAALPAVYVPRESVVFTFQSLQRLHLKYLFCIAVKVLGTVIASFVLRRHLMVWKIFSPKLLYEVIGMAVSMISVCLGHFFMVVVVSKYHGALRLNLNRMFATKNE